MQTTSPPTDRETTHAPRRLGHVRGLDGWRGVAAVIVVVSHLNIIIPVNNTLLVPGGVVSLDSFFVLSAFLITVLLLREQEASGRIDLKGFYLRRVLRLFPALAVMLAFHVVFAWTMEVSARREGEWLFSVVTYWSNLKLAFDGNVSALGNADVPVGIQHLWSLSLEEQFYVIWPMVLVVALPYARRLRTVIISVVVAMVVIALWRAHLFAEGGIQAWYPTMIRTDARFDAFLYGALAGHIWYRRRELAPKTTRALAWASIAFLVVCLAGVDQLGNRGTSVPIVGDPAFLWYGGLSAIDLACALVLFAIVQGDWGLNRVLEWKPLVVLGEVSYGIFLWHVPLLFAVQYHLPDAPDLVQLVIVVTTTSIAVALSYRFLERPSLAWKQRFDPRARERAAAAAAAAAAPAT